MPASLSGIILPKLESEAELALAGQLAVAILDVPLVAGIETAVGVERVLSLLNEAVVAVYFGAEDFVTDMGGSGRYMVKKYCMRVRAVALAARLAGVAAIDQAVLKIGDEKAFLADAALGKALGYVGKICVHPSQVARGSPRASFLSNRRRGRMGTQTVTRLRGGS